MKMLSKALAAAVAFAIVSAPSIALAESATTLDVTKAGDAATSIQSGDVVRVTSTSPIDTSGAVNQILAAVWSNQSLALTDPSTIVLPEGWALEYTTDSENWSATQPADLSTVVGIRAVGDVKTDGKNSFETRASSRVVVTQSNFQGASGGDGFGVTFGGDRVFNVFHHDNQLRIDCHFKSTGLSCYGGVTAFGGYTTGRYSEAFWDSSRSSLWVQTRQTSSGKSGFTCVDYSDAATPKLCASPFVALDTTRSAFDLETPAKIGSKIYQVNKSNWKLTCFDMAAAAACPNNGFSLPNNGAPFNDYYIGRVATAGDQKVYFTTTGKVGCYNPATNDLCGPALNLTNNNPQFPMIPIRDAAGALQGMCVFSTQQCIDGSGALVDVIPASLKTWMNAHPIPEWNTSDAGAYAEQNNRLYLPVGPSGSAGANVYCFNFNTAAACDGFSGLNVGAEIYAIIADPSIPNCLWTNGNQGRITTFNGKTGLSGCSLDYPVVEMPYSVIAPRMACNEAGRVLTWDKITFNVPVGIKATDLNVTILNSEGSPITGWENIHPDASGVLKMNSLDVNTTGTKPTIQVNAGVVDEALISQLTAVVKFEAEDPQLCFDLSAAPDCPEFTPVDGDLSVPDGLIQAAAITTSSTGKTLAASEANTSLSGTNTESVCSAEIAKMTLPAVDPGEEEQNLADTGANTGLLALALMALLLLSGGTYLVSRSRN